MAGFYSTYILLLKYLDMLLLIGRNNHQLVYKMRIDGVPISRCTRPVKTKKEKANKRRDCFNTSVGFVFRNPIASL